MSTKSRIRFALVVAAVAGTVASGCARDVTRTGAEPGTGTTAGSGPAGPDRGGDGWLGSRPRFDEFGEEAAAPGAAGDRAVAAATTAAGGAAKSGTDAATPSPASSLRAGSVDDSADLPGFLDYLGRVASAGIPFRALDPSDRTVVTVADGNGHAAAGVEVIVSEGGTERARLRTTADGTVRFHPHAYGAGAGPYTFRVGSVETAVAAGGRGTLTADAPDPGARVPLDVLFLIDATGSMGDEIDRLKATVATVVDRIEALPGQPDVRIGMTLYRDEGDSFVTATYDFTADVAAFQGALADVQAAGGGDTPEALDEALDHALAEPSWRPAGSATQLVILIGDAGGHPERQVDRPYTASMIDAAARGIKILPIAASSSDDQAEVAFRQLAEFTGGRFVFLSYGAGGAALGSSSDITKTDYEELSLDDLVVRLVADELAARTGQPIVVPPSPSTSTTNPPGQ